MKRFLLLLILCFFIIKSFAQVHVRGYYRSNGTYVQPHERTRPNHTITDNYSYPGNYNPNTGRITGGSIESKSTVVSTPNAYSNYTPSNNAYHETKPIEQDKPSVILNNRANSALTQFYVEAQTNASLKVEPTYTADSKYAIPKGSLVKVSKYNEYYYLAEINGQSGYLCTCQVKTVPSNP